MSTTDMHEGTQAIRNDQWGEFYVMAEHWQSDLEFYSDDLRFLHHLVDKYFIWITKSENLELVRELMFQLVNLERDCKELLAMVQEHKLELSKFSTEAEHKSIGEVAEFHGQLQTKIKEFVKGFRQNRKEVFRITEYVIDSEELSGIMRS